MKGLQCCCSRCSKSVVVKRSGNSSLYCRVPKMHGGCNVLWCCSVHRADPHSHDFAGSSVTALQQSARERDSQIGNTVSRTGFSINVSYYQT